MTDNRQHITFVPGGYKDKEDGNTDVLKLIIQKGDAATDLLKKIQSAVDDPKGRRHMFYIMGDGKVSSLAKVEEMAGTVVKMNSEEEQETIRKITELLESGEAERRMEESRPAAEARTKAFEDAEKIDPETRRRIIDI